MERLTALMGKPLWAQTLLPTNHWPIILPIERNPLNPIGLICRKSSAIIAANMVIIQEIVKRKRGPINIRFEEEEVVVRNERETEKLNNLM
jgi:hypothetical protein